MHSKYLSEILYFVNFRILPTQQQLHEIYEENLRLREVAKGQQSSEARNQYLEDERIALMLQNEEFMAELQRDSDFMNALEMEQDRAYHFKAATGSKALGSKNKMMDSDEFRDKLKNMGKTSKKKFSQMAAMFSRRKSAAKQFLGHAAAPSKDNLLLHAEPLVNEDDSETEEDNLKSSGSKNASKKDESGASGGGGGSSKKTPTKGKYTSFS